MNPIGKIQDLTEIDEYISNTVQTWNTNFQETKKGWFDWAKKNTANLSQVIKQLTSSLDILIVMVQSKIDLGPDKKATVLYAMEQIYDNVIKNALPIYLIPFAPAVKYVVIYVVVSNLIDFMVEKYKKGEWKDEGSVKTN